MKSVILAGLLLLATPFSVISQTQKPDSNAKDGVPQSDTNKKPADAPSPPVDYVRPDGKTRFKRYVNSVVGPVALGRQIARAGFATWQNSPEEWGPHWDGFGRRVASGFGKNVIKQTVTYGLDETLKLDSHFYRSKKKDLGSRLTNALISPVTARNTDGKRVIGIPRLVGTYSSSIIAAETWYPARYDYKDGLKSGTMSLALSAGFNLIKEFIWKK